MRVVFAGTPEFAVSALVALIAAGHEIVLVLTQPDRAVGRGLQLRPGPVKRSAEAHGLAVFQPPTLREESNVRRVAMTGADVMIVAAYGLILPRAVLEAFHFGAINIHASILPRWRGAAPIQRAILAGDTETGVSIMQMEAGLDTGPVWALEPAAIGPVDTAGELGERLAKVGARLLVDTLKSIARRQGQATPQPTDGVTYAHKIDKAEAEIDWRGSAGAIDRQVRGFDPMPGAGTHFESSLVKIWRATPDSAGPEERDTPGTILSATRDGIRVQCGEGVLTIHELQKAGGKRLSAHQYLQGSALRPGERFEKAL